MNRRLTAILLVCAGIAFVFLALNSQRVLSYLHYNRAVTADRIRRIKYTVAATKADLQRHNYFGVIHDQYGEPVPGVAVSFSLHRWNANAEGGVVRSGPDGTFSITNQVGLDLQLYRFEKAGYTPQIWSSAALHGGKSQNSSINRTVIQMWKQKGPEELVIISARFDVKPNTGPIEIDLVNGRVVQTGGDIRINVERAATKTNSYQPFDWSYRIDAINGGIQAADELTFGLSFEAPSGGYQASFDKKFLATDPRPMAQDSTNFFVMSRDNKVYSKFIFTIYANREFGQPVDVNLLKGVANPNGSPNWEQDPAKMHPPK